MLPGYDESPYVPLDPAEVERVRAELFPEPIKGVTPRMQDGIVRGVLTMRVKAREDGIPPAFVVGLLGHTLKPLLTAQMETFTEVEAEIWRGFEHRLIRFMLEG